MVASPIIKATRLAAVAKRNGWHGTLESDVVAGKRVTVLSVYRNDEKLVARYEDNVMVGAEYSLFDRVWHLHTASLVIERLQDWPDLLKILKWWPSMNKPTLVNTYRQLPFGTEDSNEDIMSSLIGRKLFWYSHVSQKLWCDVVLPPHGKKAEHYRIVDVGHRKLFHFIGAQAGFRSVLLDTLIKVG